MAIVDRAWITLSQAKEYLSVTSTGDDSLIEDLINGVTDYIQKQCGGRDFLASTGGDSTEIQDGGDGYKTHLLLKDYPVETGDITSIHYNNGDFETTNWVEFQDVDWTLYDTKGVIKFPAGIPAGSNNIRIIYTGGYQSSTGTYPMPQDLTIAALTLVNAKYQARSSAGLSSEEIGTAKKTYNLGGEGYVDKETLKTIASYKRINIA